MRSNGSLSHALKRNLGWASVVLILPVAVLLSANKGVGKPAGSARPTSTPTPVPTATPASSPLPTGPTSTSITFYHTNPDTGVAQKMYDDDNLGTFTDQVAGTQSILQWGNSCCYGDYILNLNFYSTSTPRTFFIDLSSPQSPTTTGFGTFHGLTDVHVKFKGIGVMTVGQVVTTEVGDFASSLNIGGPLAYKIRQDGSFPPAIYATVSHPTNTEWIVETNPSVGDVAVLGTLKGSNLNPKGYYHAPFYAVITIP